MTGWLVNDYLTCIPRVKTFWHFLLKWFPDLQDKTGIDYSNLPRYIETQFNNTKNKPNYIIRNATFFKPLNIPVKTISILQDPYPKNSNLFRQQILTCNNSSYVVFNSHYTRELYEDYIKVPSIVIPIGTDSELFKPNNSSKNKNTIIYVGSTNEEFKGFSMIKSLIDNTNYNFIIVLKDKKFIETDRIKSYYKVNQEFLNSLLNQADLLVCTSKKETLHLAGIEAGFCNIPIVASNVGIYPHLKDNFQWGKIVEEYSLNSYITSIEEILNNNNLNPRQSMFDNKLSLKDCKTSWEKLIKDIINE